MSHSVTKNEKTTARSESTVTKERIQRQVPNQPETRILMRRPCSIPPVASARVMPHSKKIQRFRCSVRLFIYSGVFRETTAYGDLTGNGYGKNEYRWNSR